MKKIKDHWDSLADQHALDLNSTTKTPTIKQLEVKTLERTIKSLNLEAGANILEVGCGNGHNLIPLAKAMGDFQFLGLDYSEKMISNAIRYRDISEVENVEFDVANVLELTSSQSLSEKSFDVVFTDRCLINLNSLELQQQGISQLVENVKKGGYLIIIENILDSYEQQNECREALGLSRRTPDGYNLFFDEKTLINYFNDLKLTLVDQYCFASLHDLLLYVLVPAINGGKVDYEHPIIQAASQLLQSGDVVDNSQFGEFGQNKIYILRK